MKKAISREIENYIMEFQGREDIKTRWDAPIVGFASADDSMFPLLKEVAVPDHMQPEDILPGGKSVIAYFLPFQEWIPKSNVKNLESSEEWARAYVETNILIGEINDHLVEWLNGLGHGTAKLPPSMNMDYKRLVSVWSNRHVAYVAGLGKFGLNNMLITEKGCCGRLGNVVTSLELEPDERKKTENCLYKLNGSCTACVDRCVNDALFTDSFDRFKCFQMLTVNGNKFKYLGDAEVCGKCLVALPCSFRNPVV
ncbi:MAG: epoxyqueuosine reductase [Bacillota bacterium]